MQVVVDSGESSCAVTGRGSSTDITGAIDVSKCSVGGSCKRLVFYFAFSVYSVRASINELEASVVAAI
jgi:hypothetical protein